MFKQQQQLNSRRFRDTLNDFKELQEYCEDVCDFGRLTVLEKRALKELLGLFKSFEENSFIQSAVLDIGVKSCDYCHANLPEETFKTYFRKCTHLNCNHCGGTFSVDLCETCIQENQKTYFVTCAEMYTYHKPRIWCDCHASTTINGDETDSKNLKDVGWKLNLPTKNYMCPKCAKEQSGVHVR